MSAIRLALAFLGATLIGTVAVAQETPLTIETTLGHKVVERFFVRFGDQYLASPDKTWQDMTSDDIHSLFQRIQRVYGWAPFKAWYRDYRPLANRGLKPPTTPEEKVNLTVALLSKECHVDLVPLFQQWRFPVTPESIATVRAKYGVSN